MHLCVCTYGHCRSVALTRVLHSCGLEAVAVGHHTSPKWLAIMSAVAEKILLLDEDMRRHIMPMHHHKIVVMHVGHDRWVNPYHKELNELLRGLVRQNLGIYPPASDGFMYRAMPTDTGTWELQRKTPHSRSWARCGEAKTVAEALAAIPK